MPRSNTRDPAFCAAATIASIFSRMASRFPPRRPSLPPSSITVTAGRCCASSAARRARPPAVVSPLMLALTTRCGKCSAVSRLCSNVAQPAPGGSPYPAEMLSPTIRITGDAACARAREHSNAAATSTRARRAQRNEDDQSRSTLHSSLSRHTAKRCGVPEYNARRDEESAPHRPWRHSIAPRLGWRRGGPNCSKVDPAQSPFLLMTEPVIRAQSLSKIVRSGDAPLTILDGVSFEVGAGSTVAIVGPSGSGKTTLLGLLAGLDRPTTGEVWLRDTALNGLSEGARAAVRRRR